MRKLMIASDLHGSADFCRAMLTAFEKEQADTLLLLGDLLYHGPRNDLPQGYQPKAVIKMLNPYADRILSVRGNCEAEVDQMVLDFPVLSDFCMLYWGERRVLATHGHHYHKDHLPPMKTGDILLYGHTHIPLKEEINGVLCLNPGSVSLPKGGSCHSYMIAEEHTLMWKNLEDGEVYQTCDL